MRSGVGRSRTFYLLVAVAMLLGTGLQAPIAWPQTTQPLPKDAARELVRAALLQYFDPASVFDISVSGVTLSGEVLSIDDLLVAGKPALLRGFRGDFLAHITGLKLDAAGALAPQPQARAVKDVTIVARTTAQAAEEGLSKTSPSILRPTIRFQAGQFELAATLRREDKLYPIQAIGTLLVEARQRVNLSLSRVLVSGGDIPEGVITQELLKLNPVLDASHWPFNVQIQRLTLHNDAIEVLLRNSK